MSATAEATERFDGWKVVAGVFVILAISSGLAFYNLSLYLTALKNEHGFSEGPLSVATAVVFALGGVLGIPIGRYITSNDPRRVLLFGAVVGAIALALLGRVNQLWHLFPVYGLLAVGFATIGLIPCYSIVTRWFDRRRAVAMSIASTGLSVGGVVFTPVFERVINERGLSGAAPWMAMTWIGVVVPVTLLLVKADPTSVGQVPDGHRVASRPGAAAPSISWSFDDAVRTRFFRVTAACYVLVMGSQVGGIVHTFNLVEERIDSTTAALAVSVIAFSSITARLAGGVIATRVDLRLFTAVFAFVQGLGLLMLSVSDTRAMVVLSTIVFGASIGNLLMLQPLLLSSAFGAAHYPRIYARANAITTLGLVLGPIVIGVVHDLLDGYLVSYLLAAAAASTAGLGLFVAAHPPRIEERITPV